MDLSGLLSLIRNLFGNIGKEREIVSPLSKNQPTRQPQPTRRPQPTVQPTRQPTPVMTSYQRGMPTPTPNPVFTKQYPANDKPSLPDLLSQYVLSGAKKYGIDPSVLGSLLAQESGGYGYESRVGTSGERGIPQIIPKWHYKAAGFDDPQTYGDKLESDPEFAISESSRILSGLLSRFGNYPDALAGYNAGPGRLQYGRGYAKDILGRIGR